MGFMDRYKQPALIALTVLIAIILLEILSFLALSIRAASGPKVSIFEAADTLVSRHPWIAESLPYGLYDPVVTQRYRFGQDQGTMEINASGFIHNGSDEPLLNTFPEKPDGVFRIMLLGGSSMAGNALQSGNTQTIAAYLERQLNTSGVSAETGLAFQVLNWGHSGAYSFTEAVRFLSDGIHAQPDMIMMLDGWNDTVQANLEHRRMDVPHALLNWGNLHYQFYDRMFALKSSTSGPALFTYTMGVINWMGLGANTSETRPAAYESNPVSPLSSHILKSDPTMAGVLAGNWKIVAGWAAASDVGFTAYLQPFAGHLRGAAPQEETTDLEARFRLLADIHGPDWQQDNYMATMTAAYEAYRQELRPLNDAFPSPDVQFVDLTDFFSNVAERVYLDQIHYNERGNEMLAARFAQDVKGYLAQRRRTPSETN
jgi:hypothetical protein